MAELDELAEKSWQELAALPDQAARPGGGGGGATPTSFGGKIKPVPGSRLPHTVLSYLLYASHHVPVTIFI